MKKIFWALFAVSLFGCVDSSSDKNENENNAAGAKATLSDEEKKDGWQLLFDGSSTKGWHKYGGGSTGTAWKVTDGILHLDASKKENDRVIGGGDIVTDEQYENFDLKLEWKIDTNSNSGIMFYVQEDTAKYKYSFETGPEMQVIDNNGHPDAKFPKHRAGDLYDLISCTKETAKPALEWNQVEIKCVNGKLDLWLNGENVVSTQLWDDNWKKMVSESKFKQWPGFGTFKKGGICLQEHENDVWYRNIRIKRL